MFIKTRIKYASKGGIELAVFKAFREVLIEVLVLVHLLAVLLVDGFSVVHTVIYNVYKQTHHQEKEIKVFIVELESETIKIWR